MGTYEDGFNAALEAAAKTADYWAEGHWRVTHEKRSRFDIYDMQRVNVTTAREIANDIRKLKLCEVCELPLGDGWCSSCSAEADAKSENGS